MDLRVTRRAESGAIRLRRWGSRRSGGLPAAAILLACAFAITPISAGAGETDAFRRDLGSVRFVPDIADPRSPHVRQTVSADTGLAPLAARGNLRQQLEADAGQNPAGGLPNLRHQLETDHGEASSGSGDNLRQRIEDDRTPEPVPPPRVVPNDTDPREHHRVRAPSAAPAVHVHMRVLGLQ